MKQKIIPYQKYLVPLAKKKRKNMTFSEALLWNELKQKQLLSYDFDRQKPIDQFIVDFYCKELQLAIEIDGISHYNELAYKKDVNRQQKLESLGVKFLRFDDEEIRNDMTNVLRAIEHWIIENKK